MKILDIARAEIGYLEKATNSYLDEKTANAGYNNFTKYGEWYEMNGVPWCNQFIAWCAHMAGEDDAVGKYAYVPYQHQFFSNRGEYYDKNGYLPVPGDIIFFRNDEHIGIVEVVLNGMVTAIEGNSSTTNDFTPNGGGVCRKTYYRSSSYIQGYAHPHYKDMEDNTVYGTYKNGSTPEPVYCDTHCTTKIGELNPYEVCSKLYVQDGKTVVLYQVDNEVRYKVGFVKYEGS